MAIGNFGKLGKLGKLGKQRMAIMHTLNSTGNYIDTTAAAVYSAPFVGVNQGAAINQLQTLVEKFAVARNKKSILIELKPQFEALIAAVDQDFEQASQYVLSEMTSLQPLLAKKLIESRRAERNLDHILAELEGTECGGVGRLAALTKRWLDNGVGVEELASIDMELIGYPHILTALEENRLAAEAAAPLLSQIDFLEHSLTRCSAHRVKARYAWADILTQAGSQARAQNVLLEAMSIQMGLPVEELKRSRKRRNDRERERERNKAKK